MLYIGNPITTGGNVGKITSRIRKAKTVFPNLRRSWRRYGIRLLLKDRIYNATCSSWSSLRLGNLVSPHRGCQATFCIRPSMFRKNRPSLGEHWVSKDEARGRVLLVHLTHSFFRLERVIMWGSQQSLRLALLFNAEHR